jgi:AraC-like DNA-binding protein
MSAGALCAHFYVGLAMTPRQFQRRLRMREARRLILVERLDIDSVRTRVGYEKPQEFVRDYQRAYGRAPLWDLEQRRSLFAWCEEQAGAIATDRFGSRRSSTVSRTGASMSVIRSGFPPSCSNEGDAPNVAPLSSYRAAHGAAVRETSATDAAWAEKGATP